MADLQTQLSLHTIDAMTDEVIWLDEAGQFFWANTAACDTMGYSLEELKEMAVFDVNPNMTPERWEVHWQENRRDRSVIETIHRRKDGSLFPVEIVNNFIEFNGQWYSCSIIRDISKRKEREADFQKVFEELKQSEQRSRLSHFTVQQAGDAILWITESGAIRHVNTEAYTRLGYAYEEMTQMNLLDINPSFSLVVLAEMFANLRKDQRVVFETTHAHRNGKEIPVEVSANYIEFDGEAYTCSIVRDITERKMKEAALRGALFEIKELKERLEEENNYLKEEIKLSHDFGEIITQSEEFRTNLRQVEQVAGTDTTVLITGESGTGKELIARSLHQLSRRNTSPMIKVNCAALSPTIIESELFGHEKGAFTGAINKKKGRFELANKGTLFLDELGEMPLEIQAKLLRVLQEGEFERLGGTETIKVDVRIIAATNRNLLKEIEKGKFREDLYYRLSVFPLHCLPLRERKEDIPLLVRHFCKKFEAKTGRKITNIPNKVLKQLSNYDFPGNIRELENIVERAVILSPKGKLEIGDWLPKNKKISKVEEVLTLDQLQKQHIIEVLKLTNWRVSGPKGAAKLLDIAPTTLESRMKKLGVERSFDIR